MANITIIPFAVALILSLLLTPLTIWIFRRMGWLIDPSKTPHPAHIHKIPVPKGGGIPIFLSVLAVCAMFLGWDKHLIAIMAAALITLIVGLWDDIKGASPYWRLGFNILAAIIVVASGIGIA